MYSGAVNAQKTTIEANTSRASVWLSDFTDLQSAAAGRNAGVLQLWNAGLGNVIDSITLIS